MKRPQLRDIALLALSVVVATLMGLAAHTSLSPQSDPMPADEYPFSLVSEFPTTIADDLATLEDTATRFLHDNGWPAPAASSQIWRLDGVGVLTLDGDRIGVYGFLLFNEFTDLPANPGFVLCGEPLHSSPRDSFPTSVHRLFIATLDGHPQPYHVIPPSDEALFPQSRNLGWADAGNCRQPSRP